MKEFSLRETFIKIFQSWYLMPLLSLLGAVIGWGIQQFKPPLYEAQAVFTVNINYNQPDVLDKIDNDHYAEDQMIVSVMSGIQSTEVLGQVNADAASLGANTADLILGKRLIVERKTSEVILIVRYKDPEVAVKLVNSWAEHALVYLKGGQVHALQTYVLNQKIKNLAACIQTSNDPGGLCANMDQQTLEALLQEAETELVAEVQASRSLTPAILFDFTRRASLPDAPIVFQPQVLILAGAFIGFIVSLSIGGRTAL